MLPTLAESIKWQMVWIREKGRQYIRIEFGAKRATEYVLNACNLVCVVRTSKGGENGESERHTGCYFVLLAVVAPRLKTR